MYVDDPQYMLGQGSFGKVFICFYYEGPEKEIKRTIKLAMKIITIPKS